MRRTGREFADGWLRAQKLVMPRPTPASTSTASTPRTSWRILTSVRSAARSTSPASMWRVSATSPPHGHHHAEELGLPHQAPGSARRPEHGIEQRVQCLIVPTGTPIAHVEGVFNAVVTEGDFVGQKRRPSGRGAGAGPTASAVVADLIDIARGRTAADLPCRDAAESGCRPSPMERHSRPYYVRLMVVTGPASSPT